MKFKNKNDFGKKNHRSLMRGACAFIFLSLITCFFLSSMQYRFSSFAALNDGEAHLGAPSSLDDADSFEGPTEAPAQEGDDLQDETEALDEEEDNLSHESYREEISNSRDIINENKRKIEELSNEKSGLDATLNELSSLKDDAYEYITLLDSKVSEMDLEISDLSSQIEEVNTQIETTSQELNEARKQEESQYENMKLRIKYMYENGNGSMLEALLGSENFSDFLNRAEYISNVTAYDRDKLNEFVDLRESIARREEELVSGQELLKASQEKLEEERSNLETLQAEKQSELQSYNLRMSQVESDAASVNASMAEIQKAIEAEENNISAIEERIRQEEEEARRQAAETGEVYTPKSIGDIYFSWPCPSSSRITSYFGDRESPTEGASTNHKGIDIGASSGSQVLAAASGEVVIATYSASAGNYIMLSHGGGVYSVYMHMQSMSVSVGDEVTGGDQIGLVGSTGYSTGPHLHFGIRVDGSYVNPLDYVST